MKPQENNRREEAKHLIETCFENSYSEENFKKFITNLLKGNFEAKNENFQGAYIKQAFQEHIKSYKRLFKYKSPKDKIDVLAVNLKSAKTLQKSRTMQRNFIANYLEARSKNAPLDAALVAFYSDENLDDWKFSLILRELNVKENGDVKSDYTSAKRMSFLVGKNEKSHTAKKQFLPISQDYNLQLNLKNLEEAFSTEKVSKEFFLEYKKLYQNLKINFEEILQKNDFIAADFAINKIDSETFAKKLLGQLVFLYFIQKKGWLGVDLDKNWGQGDKSFLRSQFERIKSENKNFFNDFLESLFYEALSTERDGGYYQLLNKKIPFLNGGLFESFYNWQETHILLDNSLFSNQEKTGIFDIFDLYNFTIKEDEPLEKEVAIDPEMLGKVFEELLGVEERKSEGAFYTPRHIVHFMCQESLTYYLANKFKNELNFDEITNFVENIDKNAEIESKTGEVKSYKSEISDKIKENIKEIDEALKNIKILDPAIGSGAFAVGMMQEIIRIRQAILDCGFLKEDKKKNSYQYKYEIIQNCLYGSDIKKHATEIAKLRLWLSLIIDEEDETKIKPLPNLDYKIITADSLKTTKIDLLSFNEIEELKSLKAEFFKTASKKRKGELRDKIKFLLKGDDKDLKLHFSEIFAEKGGFDVVIGNPPYIQLQKDGGKLGDLYKNFDYQVFAKSGDIYCLFYELGFNLLNEFGNLAFITSNKWMRAGYGEKLRQFLSEKTNLKLLIDLGPSVFETATVDSNILLFSKKNNQNQNCLACIVKENLNKTKTKLSQYIAKNKIYLTNFNNEAFVVLGGIEARIKAKIEAIGTKLKDWDIKINRGVLTGFNEAFIIDGKVKDELILKDAKSAEIIKPILRGKDIKRYAVDFADKWVIDAHNGGFVIARSESDAAIQLKNGSPRSFFKTSRDDESENSNRNNLINQVSRVVSEEKMTKEKPVEINNYPAIKEHLDKYYQQLETRQDKGKTPYNLRNCAYHQEFEEEKIVYSEIVREPQFHYDKRRFYPEATSFLMTGKDIKFLVAVLNSKAFTYFFNRFYAGGGLGDEGFRYKKKFLELTPIPQIPQDKQQPFITLVDEILSITSSENYNPKNPPQDLAFRQKQLEAKIDEMVFDLYGLNDEEREFICNNK